MDTASTDARDATPAGPSVESDASAIAELLARAQTGGAVEVLAEVEELLLARSGDLRDGPPALHFVRSVALIWLRRMPEVVAATSVLVAIAESADEPGWWSAALSLRAQARIVMGEADTAHFDAEAVMRDLVGAQLVFDRGVVDPVLAGYAATGIAIGFDSMRLYELALPYYEHAHRLSVEQPTKGGNPAVRSNNLALLHLSWSLECYRVGLNDEAHQHNLLAGQHAERATREPAPNGGERWHAIARVQAACADSGGDDPASAAARLAVGIEDLRERGMVTDACMARTFQAIALARSGRLEEALDVIELAGKEIEDEPGWLIRAAIQHTHARLLVEMGSPGAAVVLDYANELAQAMWRDRLRTVHAAQTLYEFEQLRTESEALSRTVATDSLTGILNRRGLEMRIVEHAACPKGETLAVLALDMDNFKELNDTRGHAAGDRALQRVAQVLGASVRAGDAVARVGGDEFAALLPGATVESAMGIAERIVAAVAAAADSPASVSVGVAVGCCSDVRLIAEAADAAMYVAKRSGGGRVALSGDPDPVQFDHAR